VPAKRLNDSALGALERPTLAWIAYHAPLWITPNLLTTIGFLGGLAAAAGYVASRWSPQWLWLASAGLLLNWAGDSLDGTVARLRGTERPRYGFFVDHTSDLFAQTAIFLALGASPCAHFAVACLGLIAFLMAFVYSLICLEVRETLRITYFGFGPTEIRVLLIAGNLITLRYGVLDVGPWLMPHQWNAAVTIYELGILVICSIAVPALAVLAVRESRNLAHEDPLPAAAQLRAGIVAAQPEVPAASWIPSVDNL
jgi:archaetidylinositol phosphate synthase